MTLTDLGNATIDEAVREIASFSIAVFEQYGEEESKIAVENWFEVLENTMIPVHDLSRHWRWITILAADKLASRRCRLEESCLNR